RAALPAPLAIRAGRQHPPRRDARRLLSAHRGSRLARGVPAVLRAARCGGLSRWVEAPQSLLEQLLVARSRGVACAGRVPAAARVRRAAVRQAAVRRAAVRRATAEYRSRERLVAKHRMTCDDLARGLADVDDQWLHYTLAAPGGGSGSEDTTLATPEGRLAAD